VVKRRKVDLAGLTKSRSSCRYVQVENWREIIHRLPVLDLCRIGVDVRSVVYCTALRTGGREEWQFVLRRYLAARDRPSESDSLLTSLVCSQQEWLLVS
jgi:hypothetical protein